MSQDQDPTAVRYWRQGDQVPINIYEGNRPVCQCHSATDAREIVQAVNNKRMGVSQQAHTKTHKDYLDEIAHVLHPNANERFAYVPDQLAGMVQRLMEGRDLANSRVDNLIRRNDQLSNHTKKLQMELDQLIAAVRALPLNITLLESKSIPLPDDPKHTTRY